MTTGGGATANLCIPCVGPVQLTDCGAADIVLVAVLVEKNQQLRGEPVLRTTRS